MNKKKIFSILSCMFYVIGLFQLADHGINTFAIICIGLGTIMLTLMKNEGKNN